ncbi:MAG: hypothetical protein AAGE96_12290 [Cyanobacteria bacterium P01_G01_bin.19]
MLDYVKKVAGVGLATSMMLAATANNAQALDFSFAGIGSDGVTATGTFRIDDAAGPNVALTDLQDWEISITGATQTFTMYGDGGSFGSDNSTAQLFSGTISSNVLTINTAVIDSVPNQADWYPELNYNNYGLNELYLYNQFDTNTFNPLNTTFTATSAATPVPFGVSTDLSLLILGGLYGASRLRKKLASK